MTGSSGDAHTPLDEPTRAEAARLGARLRGAIAEVLRQAPRGARTSAGLASALGIEGVVARRLVRALTPGTDDLRVLTRLPSPDHLRAFADAAARLDAPHAALDELRAGAGELDALQRGRGPGRAAFTKRVRATLGPSGDPGDPGGDA